jgi:hypothetical protein
VQIPRGGHGAEKQSEKGKEEEKCLKEKVKREVRIYL